MIQRIHILVEGQTEEVFVQRVLNPHFNALMLELNPIIVVTRHDPGCQAHRGGTIPYAKFQQQIKILLSDTSTIAVTMMLDYYALSRDFPGRGTVSGVTGTQRAKCIEDALSENINHHKFIPYLQLHDFEAMLFVAPDEIANVLNCSKITNKLVRIRQASTSPEEINDDPITAPAKRIAGICSNYVKPVHGPLITQRIGLQSIRNECPHFNEWLTLLECLRNEKE